MRCLSYLFVAAPFLCVVPASVAQVGTCDPAVGDAYLDINNVRARIFNNGNLFGGHDPFVYEVPKGGGAMALYSGGLWVGGLVDGELRVTMAHFGLDEFWTGPLDDEGNPPDNCSDFDGIWKINASDIEQYEATQVASTDLATWPTGLGAPTIAPAEEDGVDNDSDGSVDEAGEVKAIHEEILQLPLADRVDRTINLGVGERPAMIGDQMLWWIMNDRGNIHNFSETRPVGLEIHGMAFAFDEPGDLGNTTFYTANIFLKSADRLDSAFVAIFADTELGHYQDDLVGFDTTLGLGFVYNWDNLDGDESPPGYGANPPALGYDVFQGPIVPALGDTAYVSGAPVLDFKNLPIEYFVAIRHIADVSGDAGDGVEAYNLMRARWTDGRAILAFGDGLNGVSGHPETTIMYPGDPVAGEFWSEVNSDGAGEANFYGDRRFLMSAGPFTFNPGDHQEIVYGIVWARGSNNIDSITELREADQVAQALYDANFDVSAALATHELQREVSRAVLYPNPVAGTLVIEFDEGFRAGVDITVHDLLGRVVVKESHGPHDGDLHLDVSTLPAGRYFVRITSGRETETHLVVKG